MSNKICFVSMEMKGIKGESSKQLCNCQYLYPHIQSIW